MRSWLGIAVVTSLPVMAITARADIPDTDVPDTPAWNANVEEVTGLGVAVLIGDDSVGGGLEFSTRYGFPLGPVVLAPGGRLGGYYVDERFIGVMLGTGRATLPLGPVAPFVQAGAGFGGLSNPGDAGLAWLAGGGLMIHFSSQLAIGAEVSLQGITGTGFEVLSIGPSLVIGG